MRLYLHFLRSLGCQPDVNQLYLVENFVLLVQAVGPYLSATVSKDKAELVALDVLSHFFKEMQEKTRVVEEEEEGEDLCNCEFSLAYGMSS